MQRKISSIEALLQAGTMYDIVPGALQHLREADILSKAGLTVAAQGQEYCRTGAVHSTYRQGARLSGTVEAGSTSLKEDAAGVDAAGARESVSTVLQRYLVTVEIHDDNAWHFTCTCTPTSMIHPAMRLCVHAAALLYCWLTRPVAFALPSALPNPSRASALEMRTEDFSGRVRQAQPPPPRGQAGQLPLQLPAISAAPAVLSMLPVMPAQPVITADSLALLALGDLRAIAKEYELAAAGLSSKQELIEAILGIFRQPEVVRRTVSTLEKSHRQFLATFTLAGGFMSDDELRGLFERFGLGKPEQFQQALAKLQSKGLVLRTSFTTSQQLRGNLSSLGSLNPLEVTWFVPPEVCAALPITLPITPFRAEEQSVPPVIQLAEPYRLLADLLLAARALEGQAAPREEKRTERRGITGSLMRAASSPASSSSEGSVAIPPPAGLLPVALLERLQEAVLLSPSFLRFAYRILRLGEILYTDAEATQVTQAVQTANPATVTLRMLPNAAELLLGPTRSDVTVELFTHWLRQATYIELYELAEMRLRCRTIAPNQPALRVGELEAEHREARHWLISLLAQAPFHQWISFTSFARFVYRLYPTFLQRRQRLFPMPHWWIEQDEGQPLHPTQWNDWSRAEGRYLAQLLQGALHWWGASDIALSPDGQLLAFRLTPLAEFLFRGPGSVPGVTGAPPVSMPSNAFDGLEESAESGAKHLEPVEVAMYDMSGIELSVHGEVLIVPSAGNWPLIDLVERFTRVDGAQAGRLRYQITPASLSEALRRGEDLASFLELLRCALDAQNIGASAASSPIEEMLRGLERRIASYGRIRLYSDVTLLEAADTLTLRELEATTSIQAQVIRAIHPTMLVLKKQGGEQLIDDLKRRGQAPLLHGDE
jgi:hypothetical protein